MAGLTEDDGHDTRGIEFVAAPGFSVVAFLFSVSMFGASVALLLDPSEYARDAARLYLGTAISAVFALTTLRQALRRGVVLKVSPEGLFDQRLADTLIPWSAITGVSFYSRRGARGLVVRLDLVFQAKTSRSARLMRALNSIIGFDGYAIGVFSLSGGSQQDLEAAIARYWRGPIDGISADEQARLSRSTRPVQPYDEPFQRLPRGTKMETSKGRRIAIKPDGTVVADTLIGPRISTQSGNTRAILENSSATVL